MAKKSSKFAIKKFDGDTSESYAVFYRADVKGKGNIIFWGDAQPVVYRLSRREADYYRSKLDAQYGA